MERAGRPAVACHSCGLLVPLEDFLTWPGDSVRIAVCCACGAAITVQAAGPAGAGHELEAVNDVTAGSDVFWTETSGWCATCQCGAVRNVSTRPDGWTWVLLHDCVDG
jgi:hypothetical protein